MADSAVAITAGSGTEIDTRTEATNGHHRQVIVIGDPATNAGVAPVDATAGLKVDLGADNDVTLATLPDTAGGDLASMSGDLGALAGAVDGTELQVDVVAALPAGDNNIGNVDVVSSALPTGAATEAKQDTGNGHLSTLAGVVSSSRAAVNLIASQAGITAGAGAVAANTPRVTHASDDPAVTALQVIDDWDESDRAKVNLIVGQAGVAAGTGASGATTQRVVAASDSPEVAGIGGTSDSAATAGSTGSVNAKLRLMTSQLSQLPKVLDSDYETVAASQTNQVLGPTGATGDYIDHVLVVPATTSPGNVILLDNATSITIFTGGTDSVSNLVPFAIPLGMTSVSGSWRLTTGANVSAIGVGSFT